MGISVLLCPATEVWRSLAAMMSRSFWFEAFTSLRSASSSLSLHCVHVLTAPESAFSSCALSFGG